MLPAGELSVWLYSVKPSQGSVPAGLALALDFSFCFQCRVGSSLVLRRPIKTTRVTGHVQLHRSRHRVLLVGSGTENRGARESQAFWPDLSLASGTPMFARMATLTAFKASITRQSKARERQLKVESTAKVKQRGTRRQNMQKSQ
jgi:hypothetical protein